MAKAMYVFANRSDAELAEKIVRVRVGDNPFYNPITVEPSEVVGGYQWVLKVPNLPQDMLLDIGFDIVSAHMSGSEGGSQ